MNVLIVLAITASITVKADFHEPDPQLESFKLYQETVDRVDGEQHEVNAPSWWWRAAGWGVYIACGSVPMSVEYRNDRSGWVPTVNSAPLNATMYGAVSLGANMGTEQMRESRITNGAWAARLSALGACAWQSGWNFRKGWLRE